MGTLETGRRRRQGVSFGSRRGKLQRFVVSASPPNQGASGSRVPFPRFGRRHERRPTPEIVTVPKDSRSLRWGSHTGGRDALQRCHRRNQQCAVRRPAGDGADRRSAFPDGRRHPHEVAPCRGGDHHAHQQHAFRGPVGRGAGLKTGVPFSRTDGGGGGNRTRVRKSSATTSTCISGLWPGTRARRRLSLFRSRAASTRRIAARYLSLVLTDGSGKPPAKPA